MRESAEHIPLLIQTSSILDKVLKKHLGRDGYVPAIGGNKIARSPRKISLEHILSAVYKVFGAKFLDDICHVYDRMWLMEGSRYNRIVSA